VRKVRSRISSANMDYLTKNVIFTYAKEFQLHIHIFTYTGYFTSDNEPDGIENATHNTFAK
jgi:hypothetical protein